MNWYNKLYNMFLRLAYKNKLDAIVAFLCDGIFHDVRGLYSSDHHIFHSHQYRNQNLENTVRDIFDRKNNDARPININVLVLKANMTNLRFHTFEIEGNAQYHNDYRDDYNINMQIYINANFVADDFPKIHSLLFNILRQEIYCVIDDIREQDDINTNIVLKTPDVFKRIENISSRMLSTSEIVPYIRGISYLAAEQRLSFSDALKRFIKLNFYFDNYNYENKLRSSGFVDRLMQIENDTYDKIMVRAQRIFPDLYRGVAEL